MTSTAPGGDPTIRWAQYGSDVVLYSPDAAGQATALLDLAESISTWADLRSALEQHPDLTMDIIERSVYDWRNELDSGVYDADLTEEEVEALLRAGSPLELVLAMPGHLPCPVQIEDEDGPSLVNPINLGEMGVPEAVIKQFGEHRDSGMIGRPWIGFPEEALPNFTQLLNEMGIGVEPGSLSDLPFFD